MEPKHNYDLSMQLSSIFTFDSLFLCEILPLYLSYNGKMNLCQYESILTETHLQYQHIIFSSTNIVLHLCYFLFHCYNTNYSIQQIYMNIFKFLHQGPHLILEKQDGLVLILFTQLLFLFFQACPEHIHYFCNLTFLICMFIVME